MRNYIWAELGRRFGSAVYFMRAGEAAEPINDAALAAWAKYRAAKLSEDKEAPARGVD